MDTYRSESLVPRLSWVWNIVRLDIEPGKLGRSHSGFLMMYIAYNLSCNCWHSKNASNSIGILLA